MGFLRVHAEEDVNPHAVASLDPALMTDYICRVRDAPLDRAVEALVGYL